MKNMSLNNTFHKQPLPKMTNGPLKRESPHQGINHTLTNFRQEKTNK